MYGSEGDLVGVGGAHNQEVNAKEVEFILKLRSNDPAVGYNRRPKYGP